MSATTTRKTWLITGSSSGFGLTITRLALKAGHHVIATSRDPSATPNLVKEVESTGGLWLKLDVTASAAEIKKVVAQGTEKFGGIDILANIAGMCILGPLEDFSPAEAQRQFDVNFFGPVKLAQAVLPQMRARRSGTIVNFSSGAGINPSPAMGMYGATKFALEGFSQALGNEVSPFNIRVLIIQPGAFTTNMMNAMTFVAHTSSGYSTTPVGQFIDYFRPGAPQFKAPNDAAKGAQAAFEVITATGRGEGKEGHARCLLSSDVAERAMVQVGKVRDGYEAFRSVWESTQHDGGVRKSMDDL